MSEKKPVLKSITGMRGMLKAHMDKLISFTAVIVMFLVIMMLTTGEVGIFQDFCAICPLTGAFLTPALILTGKIGILEGLIALIVMIITVVVTYVLSATVYESMLLFQGNRLKFKDIVTLMKKQVVE